MKRELVYTEKQIDEFLTRADFDLIIQINAEEIETEELDFTRFFRLYQKKHLRKYGKTLPLHQ